jgi:hypothetical protein
MTTEGPDLLRLAFRLRHRTTCTTPDVIHFRGDRGDHGLRCRDCGSLWFPPPLLVESMEPPEPVRPARRDFFIPATPPPRSPDWPTHRARARRRRVR